MELQMKYYEGSSQLKEAAQICISNRLFVDRWSFRKWFGKLRIGEPCAYVDHMVIAYKDGVPVGVMTRSRHDRGDFMASYVRATLRRQGIATAMLKAIPDVRNPWAMTGTDRKGTFWKAVDVLV